MNEININKKSSKIKLIIKILVYTIAIPLIVILGEALAQGNQYHIIASGIALLACVPFFIRFEKGKFVERELLVIACMTALSVLGRELFIAIPHFKPVTAVVIITAIAFGGEAGFLTGALTAVISNIFQGQGPWTPFQMCAWGLTGLFSGLIFHKRRDSANAKCPHWVLLAITGVISGIAYSLFMDIYTPLLIGGSFSFDVYLSCVIAALPITATYAVSNTVFLLLLAKPILSLLNRIRNKYGIFLDVN